MVSLKKGFSDSSVPFIAAAPGPGPGPGKLSFLAKLMLSLKTHTLELLVREQLLEKQKVCVLNILGKSIRKIYRELQINTIVHCCF